MIIFKNKHYFLYLLGFKNAEIDFDLFQEAITFNTTESYRYIANIYHPGSKKWFWVF